MVSSSIQICKHSRRTEQPCFVRRARAVKQLKQHIPDNEVPYKCIRFRMAMPLMLFSWFVPLGARRRPSSDGWRYLPEASCSTSRNCPTSAGQRSMQSEVLTSRFETISPTRSDSHWPSLSQPLHGRGEFFPMQSEKGICSRSCSVQHCVGFCTVKDPVRAVFCGHLPQLHQ